MGTQYPKNCTYAGLTPIARFSYVQHLAPATSLVESHGWSVLRRAVCVIMVVFIDESGCCGFKLARGSDPVFAIAMVIFRNALDAARTEAALLDCHASL